MRIAPVSVLATLVVALLSQSGGAQQAPAGTGDADWPMYRHDSAGTGHSTLTSIDPRNVATLRQAWSYSLLGATNAAPAGRGGGPPTLSSEATPIVAAGTMYLPAAGRIVALDPATGRELWRYAVNG